MCVVSMHESMKILGGLGGEGGGHGLRQEGLVGVGGDVIID